MVKWTKQSDGQCHNLVPTKVPNYVDILLMVAGYNFLLGKYFFSPKKLIKI